MVPDWMLLATRGRAVPLDLDVPGTLQELPAVTDPPLCDPDLWMENSWDEVQRLDAEHLLVAIVDTPAEELQRIPGIGPKMSRKISSGLQDRLPDIEALLGEGVAVYVEVPCIVGPLFSVDGDAEGETIHVLLVKPRKAGFPAFIELRSSNGYRLMGPRMAL